MARSAAETERKSREAFLELFKRGEYPTAAKIRAMIGGGGTDVINRVINDMNVKMRSQMFELANRPDVPTELVDLILHVWTEANRLADGRYVVDRDDARRRISEADEAKRTALARGAEMQVRIESLEEQLAIRTGEASALRTAMETAESRIRGLERIVFEKSAELDRIRQEAEDRVHAAEMRQAEQERMADERYRALEHHLMENFDRERTQLGRDIERLKGDVQALTGERETLRGALSTANATILRQKDACASMATELAETKGRLGAMIEERERADKRSPRGVKFSLRPQHSRRSGRGKS